MGQTIYEIGRAYYQIGTTSFLEAPNRPSIVTIETWFYQGYFKLDWNTTSCDIPHHFYVFQPFVPLENVLDRSPEHGLKIPSLRGAELSMLTFEELVSELNQIKLDE